MQLPPISTNAAAAYKESRTKRSFFKKDRLKTIYNMKKHSSKAL